MQLICWSTFTPLLTDWLYKPHNKLHTDYCVPETILLKRCHTGNYIQSSLNVKTEWPTVRRRVYHVWVKLFSLCVVSLYNWLYNFNTSTIISSQWFWQHLFIVWIKRYEQKSVCPKCQLIYNNLIAKYNWLPIGSSIVRGYAKIASSKASEFWSLSVIGSARSPLKVAEISR